MTEADACAAIARRADEDGAEAARLFRCAGAGGFAGLSVAILSDVQRAARPAVDPAHWWRHWWHFVPELACERETDILLLGRNAEGALGALHIEVKIDARFTPGQSEGYRAHARHMMAAGRPAPHQCMATLLVVPARRLAACAGEAAHFGGVMALEDALAL